MNEIDLILLNSNTSAEAFAKILPLLNVQDQANLEVIGTTQGTAAACNWISRAYESGLKVLQPSIVLAFFVSTV